MTWRESPSSPSPNPFRSAKLRPGVIPYLFHDDTTVEDLLDRFEALGRFAEIVGPHGTGKSTLVEMLCSEWLARGHEVVSFRLQNNQRQLPFQRQDWIKHQRSDLILIIDGAEQLRPSKRWMWRIRCRRFRWGLLLTTHKSLGSPPLWTTDASPGHVALIARRLLHQEYPDAILEDQMVRELLLKHHGNVRETLFGLFDFWREIRE